MSLPAKTAVALVLAVLLAIVALRSFQGADGERGGSGSTHGSAARASDVTGEPGALGELPAAARRQGPRDPLLAEKYARRDATADGWAAERFEQAAGRQLGRLKEFLKHPDALDERAAASLVTRDFHCRPLRPRNLAQVWTDGAFAVSRAARDDAAERRNPGVDHRGRAGFADAFAALVEPLRGAASGRDEEQIYAKTKIVDAAIDGDRVVCTVLFHASARPPLGPVEISASWRTVWKWAGGDADDPVLDAIELVEYEEVRGESEVPPFADCSEAVLGGTSAWREQLLPGLDAWAARLEGSLGVSIVGHQGLAVGDVDGDGLDDLFVCQPGGLPNRLFVQNDDGTTTELSREAGLDHLDMTRSALVLDFDGDGDQDLCLAMDPRLVFFANQGNARFVRAAVLDAPSVTSLAAADFDLDGDLDVYACGYMLPDRKERSPVPYHDANNGRPNLMFRNDGGFRFTEVAAEVGLDENNRRFSFAAAWEDYDDDGDPDLYVANDYGRNNLYQNRRGEDGPLFVDVAAAAGVEDIAAGMGVSWADVDRDGRMDLYVSNMFSSAGGRVTFQREFRPELDRETRAAYRRHARGNTLFQNAGNGTFRDVSLERGVTMGRWAWGARLVELNNDGWPDVFVPNGFVTGEDPVDL